jgi:hypothetical protein
MGAPLSLLAALLGALSPVDPPATPAQQSGAEWTELDRRLDELSTELETGREPLIRAWVQASWRTSSSGAVAAQNGGRLSGFRVDSARVDFAQRWDGFGAVVQLDFASDFFAPSGSLQEGQGTVLDAYATWWFQPEVSWSMGRFRRPFLRSSELSRDALLFLDRTTLGEIFAVRDEGILFSGDFQSLRWGGAIQNGEDGLSNSSLYSLRVEIEPTLRGAPPWEGARDAPEETALTIGLAFSYEDGVKDGLVYSMDAALARKPFALAFETVWFEEGPFALRNPALAPIGLAQPVENTRPWAATASVIVLELQEIAARWQSTDDIYGTESLGLAVVRHLAGPAARWIIQWDHVFTTAPSGDFDLFGVGLLVSL